MSPYPIRIENGSSETPDLSIYQVSLRSDRPFIRSKYLNFLPIPPAPLPSKMVESGKQLLSSQFVQVPDMPTHFHLSSTFRSTKLAKALKIPTPQLPQRERIWSGYVNHISRTSSHKFLPTKFNPDLSSLSVFQYFQFPPPTPPDVTEPGSDLK